MRAFSRVSPTRPAGSPEDPPRSAPVRRRARRRHAARPPPRPPRKPACPEQAGRRRSPRARRPNRRSRASAAGPSRSPRARPAPRRPCPRPCRRRPRPSSAAAARARSSLLSFARTSLAAAKQAGELALVRRDYRRAALARDQFGKPRRVAREAGERVGIEHDRAGATRSVRSAPPRPMRASSRRRRRRGRCRIALRRASASSAAKAAEPVERLDHDGGRMRGVDGDPFERARERDQPRARPQRRARR